MATWRVFKKQTAPADSSAIVSWDEFPPIENAYSYVVDADDVGPVAGEGRYLCVSGDKVVEIEVRGVTRWEVVSEPEPEVAEQHSVAVGPIHGGDDS